MKQTIVRVFGEGFGNSSSSFINLQDHLNNGWTYVASTRYPYKSFYYTDYILQKQV